MPPTILHEVNEAVTAALDEEKRGKKRKYNTSYTPEDRADIGRYAAENGNAAAVKKFKDTHDIGESTVRLFKKRYLDELKKLDSTGKTEVKSLPKRHTGRKVLIGNQLDAKVQEYVRALRNAGTPIGSSIVMAAGEGIVNAHDRTLLVEHGGHIQITKTWALSLLKRMGYVKRKATTKSTPGMSNEDFEKMKAGFLNQIANMVQLYQIPDSLIINLDQTGLKLVPAGEWTMAAEGSKRVEVIGLSDKRQITATFAATLNGDFLPMQILYQGKTSRSHPKYKFPSVFDIFHTPNHWANEETCVRFFSNIICPYVNKIRESIGKASQKALILMDNFSGQTTASVLEKMEIEGIVVVFIPPGTTDRLQPLESAQTKLPKTS